MVELEYLKAIRPIIPKIRIYRRLGYQEGKTRVTARQKKEIDGYVKDAAGMVKIKAVICRLGLKNIRPGAITLSNGLKLNSHQLSSLLAGCQEVFFMASTAGNRISKAIQDEVKGGNFTRGIVLDAVASEMVDASLDLIMARINKKIKKSNLALTRRRFSCGYGDFILENQKVIYKMLDLRKLGISLTKSSILVPEKSVTAIAGVKGI